ncbi:4'-phosphopantetheinyl transferase family protein [Bradyrhizobium jicamae]|uniref:4'-phosphopantetheinyl transferase family protein n=1 Tax=Bradyrhizobium jicamae TaxID=280332 RepID=UPI0018DB6FA6|nr:4'-phosphopantetheinyl transferase superfamily protein [Bradyrhizobium jicamae]
MELLFVSIDVTPSVLARLLTLLTSAEADRVFRFHCDEDRRRSIIGRAALRYVLSRHLGVEPQALRFDLGENGKPFLQQSDIHFNVSHSGEIVAIALAPNQVGVDIEAAHHIPEMPAIAGRFFSENEMQRVRTAIDPTDQFFRIWTMKEAVLKAAGQGLGLPLDCFTVPASAPAPRPVMPVGEPPIISGWFVVHLELPAGYYGAVAMHGYDWRVVTRWLPARNLTAGR